MNEYIVEVRVEGHTHIGSIYGPTERWKIRSTLRKLGYKETHPQPNESWEKVKEGRRRVASLRCISEITELGIQDKLK